MKMLLMNKKNVLAIIAGILFSGLVLNTINEISPTPVFSVNQNTLLNETEVEIINLETEDIKEYILEESISTKAQDAIYAKQVADVRSFLTKRNAPLADYAEEFVKAANEYGIDYRLVAAISIIESSGGQHTFRTYNAWGWGKMNFKSWEEGIWTVSKGMGNYYARGMTTPRTIAPVYCPPNATNWANNVNYIMSQIGK